MPEKNIAITDTSVLIAFEKLNMLEKLCSIYNEVTLPKAVYHEYSGLIQNCFTLTEAPPEFASFLIYNTGLGVGESEVISLAYHTGTKVLIDDAKARKVAFDLGCIVSGTIGALCKMENKGVINSAYNEALNLKTKGFYVSDKILNKIR
mgnify:CR=1 FL=1